MKSLLFRLSVLKLLLLTVFQATETTPDLSMKGRHFRTAIWEQYPAWTFIRAPNGTVIGFSGGLHEMIKWLSEKLQFTYTIVPVFQYKSAPFPNGTWIGAHEMLRKKEVDFITSIVSLNPSLQEILDFTSTVVEAEQVFLVPTQKEESRLLAPIKPFTFTVWMLIFGSVIAIITAIYGIIKGDRKRTAKPGTLNLTDVGMTVAGVTFGQNEFSSLYTPTERMRILLAMFCLTLVVLVNSYTGTFISFATTPTLIPLPKDAEDVAFNSGLRYVALSFQDLRRFSESSRSSFRKLGESLRDPKNLFTNESALVEAVASGCCAFLYPKVSLNIMLALDFKQVGRCRCAMTQESAATSFYSFGCQKGSPYCGTLSKQVMIAREMGFTLYWYDMKLPSVDQCVRPEKPKYRRLTVKDLSGVFLILIGGVSFSATIFFIEVCLGRRTSRSRTCSVPATESSSI